MRFLLVNNHCISDPTAGVTQSLRTIMEFLAWYDAVCCLWDDPAQYEAVAARARQIADERYSEAVSRRAHVEFFTALKRGGRPLAGAAIGSHARG